MSSRVVGGVNYDWAELVQLAAFAHVQVAFGCSDVELGPRRVRLLRLGHVGAARRCRRGWAMSARLGDVGTPGNARFAQATIARVGQAIALAVGEVVQALFGAVCRADSR